MTTFLFCFVFILRSLKPAPSTMIEFTRFPLEVFEMIIGRVSFVDLPYFIQTSKTIKVTNQSYDLVLTPSCHRRSLRRQHLARPLNLSARGI
jgi:hypothetical protein